MTSNVDELNCNVPALTEDASTSKEEKEDTMKCPQHQLHLSTTSTNRKKGDNSGEKGTNEDEFAQEKVVTDKTMNDDDDNDENESTMPLHDACREGRFGHVKVLLLETLDVIGLCMEQDENKCTPLLLAVRAGDLSIIQLLLDQAGPELLEATDCDHLNALQLAAYWGQTDIVIFLIETCGMNVNEQNEHGLTVLHLACKEMEIEIVKYLLEEEYVVAATTEHDGDMDVHLAIDMEATCHLNWTALHYAIKEGSLDICKLLIEEYHADVDARNNENYTMLHLATDWGHMAIVKYLVEEHDVDVEAKSDDGWKPLHLAVKENYYDMVRYFLEERGVDATAKQDFGYEPIHMASIENCLKIAKYLVEDRGISPTTQDKHGFTPLHCAAGKGSMEVLKYLLEDQGLDILSRDHESWTPLHVACRDGQLDVLKYLIEERSCIDTVICMEGRTPLHFASIYGKRDVAKYLVEERGANLSEIDRAGATPLHLACLGGYLEVVKYLAEQRGEGDSYNRHGVDLEATDSDGWTGLHCAANKGHLDILQYLLEENNVAKDAVVHMTNQNTLHLAISSEGHLPVVKYLIEEQGFDMNAISLNEAQNSLQLAVSDGHLEIVKYLVEEHNADVLAADNRGYTPLHIAAVDGRFHVLQYLAYLHRNGLEFRDNTGQTPLHHTSRLDRFQMTAFLLNRGGNPFAVDNEGNTPLHVAAGFVIAECLVHFCGKKQETLLGERSESICDLRSRMLFAKNKKGQNTLQAAIERMEKDQDEGIKDERKEIVCFLQAYVEPLAVPSPHEDRQAPSIKLNPELNEAQKKLAEGIYRIVESTGGHNVAYHILGYLCLSDVKALRSEDDYDTTDDSVDDDYSDGSMAEEDELLLLRR